jgi:hypothetical protein
MRSQKTPALCWFPTIRSCDTKSTDLHSCSSSALLKFFPFTPSFAGPPSFGTLVPACFLPPAMTETRRCRQKNPRPVQRNAATKVCAVRPRALQLAESGHLHAGAGVPVASTGGPVGRLPVAPPGKVPFGPPLAPTVAMP